MNRSGQTAAAAAMLVACLVCAGPDADAARIGARIYLQPWTPQDPDQDLQTFYRNDSVISDDIDEAWGEASSQMTNDLPQMLAEHDIGGGFRTYNAVVTLNPISDYRLIPDRRGNGGMLEFTIPGFHIEMSIRSPKLTMIRRQDDPRFSADADLVIQVAIGVAPSGPKILSVGSVNAVLRNLRGPDPMNDSAHALNDVAALPKALLSFLTGEDFDAIVEGVINQQNIARSRLQPLLDAKLDAINTLFGSIPGAAFLPRKMWADHDRITLYAAPPAIPDEAVPRDGAIGGTISWDSTRVTGACASVRIEGAVKTGPPVLLASDGESFAPAPTLDVGRFNLAEPGDAWQMRAAAAPGPQRCAYRLSYVPRGWPTMLHASADFVSDNGSGTSDPYVNAHHAAKIEPDGWSGRSATADADDVNYVVVDEMAGGARVGNPRDMHVPPDAGEQNTAPGAVERGTGETPWAERRRRSRGDMNDVPAAPQEQQGEGQ